MIKYITKYFIKISVIAILLMSCFFVEDIKTQASTYTGAAYGTPGEVPGSGTWGGITYSRISIKTIVYDYTYIDYVDDYCVYNGQDQIFSRQTAWPSENKTVNVEGYTFNAARIECTDIGAYYTPYATNEMPRGADVYEDDSFVGFERLNYGQEYYTARHYKRTRYYGVVYVGVYGDDYPKHEASYIVGADYINGNMNWFKLGHQVEMGNIYSSPYSGLLNIYSYLVEDTTNNVKLSMYNHAPSDGTYIDFIDSNFFGQQSYGDSRFPGASWWGYSSFVDGGPNLRRERYIVLPKKEAIYRYNTDAINTSGNWALPDKSQAISIDSGQKVGIDGTAPSIIFTPNSQSWINTNVIVGINPSDTGGSGVKQWRYRTSKDGAFDTEAWSSYTIGDTSGNITLNSEGQWKIQIEATDNVDNIGFTTSGIYQIDLTDPLGTFTPNSQTWTNVNVITNFNPSDTGGSGVKQWRYRTSKDGAFDTEAWSSYTIGDTSGNITLTGEGQWKIQAEITDNASNINTVISGTYQIDLTDPLGTFTPNSQTWTNVNVITNFNPSDTGGSGVKQWRYRTSSNNGVSYGLWSNYTIGDTSGNITLTGEGQWIIQTEIIDIAGNIGTITSGTYQIDLTKPLGTFTPNSQTWINVNVTTNFNPSDTGGSGVKQWRYRTSKDGAFDTEGWSSYTIGDTSEDITLNSEGQWKIQAEIIDNASNINTVMSGIYQIDLTDPVLSGNLIYGWTKEDVTISLAAADTLSGMKSIELYNNDNIKVSSGINSLSYKVTTQGIERFKVKLSDNANNVIENYVIVKIDRTAPNGVVTTRYDDTTFDLDIDVNKVVETESGVSKIWIEYYDVDVPTNVIKRNLNYNGTVVGELVNREDFNSDGVLDQNDLDMIGTLNNVQFENINWDTKYDLNQDGIIDIYDISKVTNKFGEELSFSIKENLSILMSDAVTVGVRVKAIDMVGNERILGEEEVDLFTLKASIVRVLEPHEPIFKGGEKGYLKITTTGKAEKLKITFPYELSQLDSSLDQEVILGENLIENTQVDFFIPLEAINKSYPVQVDAFKKGRKKTVYPTFEVIGKVTEEFRTRVVYKRD